MFFRFFCISFLYLDRNSQLWCMVDDPELLQGSKWASKIVFKSAFIAFL